MNRIPEAAYVCECVSANPKRRFVVVGLDGDRVVCDYCEECAELAQMNWTGETLSVTGVSTMDSALPNLITYPVVRDPKDCVEHAIREVEGRYDLDALRMLVEDALEVPPDNGDLPEGLHADLNISTWTASQCLQALRSLLSYAFEVLGTKADAAVGPWSVYAADRHGSSRRTWAISALRVIDPLRLTADPAWAVNQGSSEDKTFYLARIVATLAANGHINAHAMESLVEAFDTEVEAYAALAYADAVYAEGARKYGAVNH